jgi:hypothetical protein
MTDYKEFAKQMRENAIKNEQGNIVCSPELWEEIVSVIERAIVPPCKVGDYAKYKYNGAEAIWEITSISFYKDGEPSVSLTHGRVTNTVRLAFFNDRFEMIPKEQAEAKLKELGK